MIVHHTPVKNLILHFMTHLNEFSPQMLCWYCYTDAWRSTMIHQICFTNIFVFLIIEMSQWNLWTNFMKCLYCLVVECLKRSLVGSFKSTLIWYSVGTFWVFHWFSTEESHLSQKLSHFIFLFLFTSVCQHHLESVPSFPRSAW